jgi:hypothetical protein
MAAILADRPRQFVHAGPLAPTLTALLTKPAGGHPSIPETRHLLQPLTGSPSASTPAEFPVDPGGQPPTRSGAPPATNQGTQGGWGQAGFHSPLSARPATRGPGRRWTRWCGGCC